MNGQDLERTNLPLLEQAHWFQSLPREALRLLAGGSYTRTVSRDQVVYQKGQTLDGFFLLITGRIKLAVLSPEGAERVLDIVLPGQTFAECTAFLGRPYPLYAQALTDSRLLNIDLSRLRRAIQCWPEVAFMMLTLVSARTRRLTEDLESCCLHSANQRVAGFMLRNAESHPDEPDRATLMLPAAKAVVASSLNLSPETFSRELHALARQDLIAVERRLIHIPSLTRLQALTRVEPPWQPESGGLQDSRASMELNHHVPCTSIAAAPI